MSRAESPIKPIDASAEALKRQLKDHSIIWIGAGASIAAGYPSAARLVAALKEAADDPITSDDFPEATDEFVRSRGEAALRVLLQREIGGGRPSTDFHRALAALAQSGHVHTVITTNYDDLIERTLAHHGVPCIVQTFEANFEAASRSTVRLIKVHGSYQDWSQVILSGDSYVRFAKAYRRLGEQLNVLCRQYPLTFVGSSLLEPRVLGWLAALKRSERKDLLPWRAFLTLKDWNLLLEYKTQEFEARTLLVGQFRPLILKEHAALQTIWTEVARELAPSQDRTKTDSKASVATISELVRGSTLLREAVGTVSAVSYGGGSTTHLHRRIGIAEKWLQEAQNALNAVRAEGADQQFLAYLKSIAAQFSDIAADVKHRLPKAGEADIEARQYAPSAEFRHSIYFGETQLKGQLAARGLADELPAGAKWQILGFEDQEAFDDYVFPRLAQLIRSNDAKVRELLHRLLKDPNFSPAGLAAEGHRKSVVMDVVNALLREEAAVWTDLGVLGSKARGRLTTSGQELLKKLMTE
jgi:NAD-dependent SIR2 family protein deacetylase